MATFQLDLDLGKRVVDAISQRYQLVENLYPVQNQKHSDSEYNQQCDDQELHEKTPVSSKIEPLIFNTGTGASYAREIQFSWNLNLLIALIKRCLIYC